MRIADLANAPLEMDARALMDDVGGFVGSRMKVGGRCERHMIAGGECLCPHRASAVGSRGIHVCFDAADVMAAESTLDDASER